MYMIEILSANYKLLPIQGERVKQGWEQPLLKLQWSKSDCFPSSETYHPPSILNSIKDNLLMSKTNVLEFNGNI